MGTYVGVTALSKGSNVRVPALAQTPTTLAGTVVADGGSTFAAGTNTYYWVVSAVTASGQTLKSNEISKSVNGPRNEVQTVTVNATSGNFTLTFSGQTTANIAFNASNTTGASSVRQRLEDLSNIAPGDVTVTGGPGDSGGTTPYQITYGGAYANTNVAQITATSVSLAGGGAAVTTGTTTAGRPGDTVSLTWDADSGADSYRVWRGTSAAGEDHYQTVTTNSLTDTGATGTAGTLPTGDTATYSAKLVPGTVHIVDVDDAVVRKTLASHSSVGQYVVVAVNTSTATATLPSNS